MQASRDSIQKISRLPNQDAYTRIRKSETRWVSEGFALQVLPKIISKNLRAEAYGLSVTVSKKTARLAVARNRIRRRLKAVALEILPGKAMPEMDYMLTARAKIEEKDYESLKKDLLWCLKRLNLLQE